jgi:hypothetical protein
LTDATELLDKTMKARVRLSLDGDDMAKTMTELGVAYLYLGRHEEAVELNQKALVDRRESFGEKYPSIAETPSCRGLSPSGKMGRCGGVTGESCINYERNYGRIVP